MSKVLEKLKECHSNVRLYYPDDKLVCIMSIDTHSKLSKELDVDAFQNILDMPIKFFPMDEREDTILIMREKGLVKE